MPIKMSCLMHRVIILNRGSMFAFQWREDFSHRQKRDRRRCNSWGTQNTYFSLPLLTRAIDQWARSLEWRHAVTLHILVGKICISFFLFFCEGMLSLVVLWLFGLMCVKIKCCGFSPLQGGIRSTIPSMKRSLLWMNCMTKDFYFTLQSPKYGLELQLLSRMKRWVMISITLLVMTSKDSVYDGRQWRSK